jgi:hypothetical protein
MIGSDLPLGWLQMEHMLARVILRENRDGRPIVLNVPIVQVTTGIVEGAARIATAPTIGARTEPPFLGRVLQSLVMKFSLTHPHACAGGRAKNPTKIHSSPNHAAAQ